jgi:hypothetical protein
MAHGIDKERSRRNRAQVRDILMREWDPIGVSGCEGAEDEYDRYGAKAYVMLMDEQASADALEVYFYDIAISHMGLSPTEYQRQAARRAANALFAARAEFELP